MKDLEKILSEYVLRAIADDYENFERILQDVTGWAAERGIVADHRATQKALEGLVSDGYAQPYLLFSGPPGKAEATSYSAASLDELWFYLTPKGKQCVQQLQKGWS
jgi:hypothetical protein